MATSTKEDKSLSPGHPELRSLVLSRTLLDSRPLLNSSQRQLFLATVLQMQVPHPSRAAL